MIKKWEDLEKVCRFKASKLGGEYTERLEFEFKEIIKQGANEYWLDLVNSGEKFDHNKNGLVIAFLVGATEIDPIKGNKKLFINGDEMRVDGVEIILENGLVITTSRNTMIKTVRGYIEAQDLLEDDEVCLD